jgi:hypothetical protein
LERASPQYAWQRARWQAPLGSCFVSVKAPSRRT